MKTLAFLPLFALVMGLVSCKDKEKIEEPLPALDLTCVKLYDENGQDLGIYGCNSSNDWANIPLTDEEKVYFNNDLAYPLEGTSSVQVAGVAVYPIPASTSFPMSFSLLTADTAIVLFKIAIIDEKRNVVRVIEDLLPANSTISILLTDNQFEKGKFYRLYYQVSAEGAPSIYEGYGNFVVCKAPPVTSIGQDCL